MLKRKSEQFLWLLACALWVASAYPQDDFADFDLDDISIAISVDQAEERQMHAIDATLTKACDPADKLTPFQVVEVLTFPNPTLLNGLITLPPLLLQNILQNFSFYKFTNPPVVRELHDIPTLMPFQYHCAPSWAFSANGFYNQTKKKFYTQQCPLLGSYLNLQVPDEILDYVDQLEEVFNTTTPVDQVPQVFDIFGNNLTFEERRLGAMLDVWKHYKRWLFTAALPVYYIEHNFFLSETRQRELQELPLFTGSAGLPGLNFNNFTLQHLVRDQAGIGDLRLQVLYNLASQKNIDDHNQQLQIGGQITFPTARKVISGINGGPSCKLPPPLIDWLTMFNLGICAIPELQNDKKSALDLRELNVGYGIAALDQLSETVLDLPLGQKHVNLGPIVHIQQPIWCRNSFASSFELYGEMKYSIPANEDRFFKIITPAADFNRDYASEAAADSNLTFLNQQTTNLLFPALIKIKTKPGLMFHTNIAFNGFWEEWEAGIGYDFWAQLQEKFGQIQCKGWGYGNRFDLAAGRKFSAYEGKIFGQAGMRLCGETFALRFLIRGDATIHQKGIGNSFTLGLNFIIDY